MLDKNTEMPIVSADTHTLSMLSLLRVNFSIKNSMPWEFFFSLKCLPIFNVTGVSYYCYITSHWNIFPPEHVMSFRATGTNIFSIFCQLSMSQNLIFTVLYDSLNYSEEKGDNDIVIKMWDSAFSTEELRVESYPVDFISEY